MMSTYSYWKLIAIALLVMVFLSYSPKSSAEGYCHYQLFVGGTSIIVPFNDTIHVKTDVVEVSINNFSFKLNVSDSPYVTCKDGILYFTNNMTKIIPNINMEPTNRSISFVFPARVAVKEIRLGTSVIKTSLWINGSFYSILVKDNSTQLLLLTEGLENWIKHTRVIGVKIEFNNTFIEYLFVDTNSMFKGESVPDSTDISSIENVNTWKEETKPHDVSSDDIKKDRIFVYVIILILSIYLLVYYQRVKRLD